MQVMNDWIKKTPTDVVTATTGIRNEISKEQLVNRFVKEVGSPWYRYFLRYDPAPVLKKIKADVLALYGANLTALKAALQKSGSKNVEVVELKGLNHLFQRCRKCTITEYGELEETIAPEALEVIGNWLDKHVK